MTTTQHKEALCTAVSQIIKDEAETFIKTAVAEYEAALRKKIAHIVLNVNDYYSVERMGQELIIRVMIGKEGSI